MDGTIGYLIGFIVGVIITAVTIVHQAAENIENFEVCKRTIQYQLDKTPEEVHTLIQIEKKREGR